MNFRSLPFDGQPDVSLQPGWQRQIDAWRDLIGQCARKPSRERVHALRSRTLRLRVALGYRLQEQAQDQAGARAFKRWSKEGKKLRRALEPIRDADVYLARLDALRDTLGGAPDGKPKVSPRCLREIDKVESLLKKQRQEGADELAAVIGDRKKRLNRHSKELEAALAPRMTSTIRSAAQAALRVFAGLATEIRELDSSNLHAYRKRLKRALYLAELSATADPLAGRLAAAFRGIHSAVGEWHDWQSLALEAGRILPERARQDGLVPVLETLAEEALQKALGVCRGSAQRLLKNVDEIQNPLGRKPVAPDHSGHPGEEHRLFAISS